MDEDRPPDPFGFDRVGVAEQPSPEVGEGADQAVEFCAECGSRRYPGARGQDGLNGGGEAVACGLALGGRVGHAGSPVGRRLWRWLGAGITRAEVPAALRPPPTTKLRSHPLGQVTNWQPCSSLGVVSGCGFVGIVRWG